MTDVESVGPARAHESIAAPDVAAPASVGPWRRSWRRLRRNRPALAALGYISVLVFVAVFAPLVARFDPNFQNLDEIGLPLRFAKPSGRFWLGTDDLGRDMVARLLFGARVSLGTALQVVVVALVLALPLGLLGGYKGGLVDNVIMRAVDTLGSIPSLILALVTVAILGPGLRNVGFALGIVLAPGFLRLIRAQTLGVRTETFIEASESIGTRTSTILRKRVLPNVLSPLIVAIASGSGGILIAEASLSFLGFGVKAPNPSWGSMLSNGYRNVFTNPEQFIIPSVALSITVLALNVLGDGIRDALGLGIPTAKGLKGRLGLTSVSAETARSLAPSVAAAPSAAALKSENPATGDSAVEPVGALLSVRDLAIEFHTENGVVRVVDGVSFDVAPGEVLGLVGESGSGKSVTSLAIMRLLASPPAQIVGGSVRLNGRELLTMSHREMRGIRGSEIAMVFQDPMTSLNPAFTVGNLLNEVLRRDGFMNKPATVARALELLDLVGIPDPKSRLRDYPHQLSGGMRQRALLAVALAREPKLLIADEPTTALDVTVQAQILDLLRRLRSELNMGIVFITHDLSVVADFCDRVAVMYAGRIVEHKSVDALFARPGHPYTEGLLGAIPQLGVAGEELRSIPGVVPTPFAMPKGCRFGPRCPYAEPRCHVPGALDAHADHRTMCLRSAELKLQGAE